MADQESTPPSSTDSSSLPSNGHHKGHERPFSRRSLAYLAQPVSTRHASLLLLTCCLISGLTDSVAYNAWSTFISMQTGNTIFLGLGASGQPTSKPYGWAKSLMSIGCFFTGCVCFSHGMRGVGRAQGKGKARTRGALLLSFALQAALMLVAAWLVQGKVVPVPKGASMNNFVTAADQGDPDFIELLPIGLLAFQGGGQFVASRVLGFGEIPTVVLTSVYCDLGMDERLLATDNQKRNHRVGAVVMIVLGAIAGGWISRSDAGMATAMWIAAGLKLGIAVAWVFWRREEEDEE